MTPLVVIAIMYVSGAPLFIGYALSNKQANKILQTARPLVWVIIGLFWWVCALMVVGMVVGKLFGAKLQKASKQ
jgi:hypothetical protein